MKRELTVLPMLAILASFYSTPAKAQDGIFSDAQLMSPKQVKLGIQPAIFTEPDEFMLIFRGAYGMQPKLSLHAKVGIFDNRETYFGGHIQYQVAAEPGQPVSFAVLGGIYSFGEVGLKLSGVLSKNLDSFSLYSGLSYEPLFSGNTIHPILIPIGVSIPAAPEIDFMMEGDIAINEDGKAYQAVTFGLNFYF